MSSMVNQTLTNDQNGIVLQTLDFIMQIMSIRSRLSKNPSLIDKEEYYLNDSWENRMNKIVDVKKDIWRMFITKFSFDLVSTLNNGLFLDQEINSVSISSSSEENAKKYTGLLYS